MKVGIRTPNIEKSIKARTTGKIDRKIKRSINPLYEKKGMGYINNPQKSVYNKVYNKTSVSITKSFMPKKGDGLFVGVLKIVFLLPILVIWLFYYYIKLLINLFNKIKNKN